MLKNNACYTRALVGWLVDLMLNDHGKQLSMSGQLTLNTIPKRLTSTKCTYFRYNYALLERKEKRKYVARPGYGSQDL